MCSIVGYDGEFKGGLVNQILKNSRIRGLHAFGYSYFENEILKVFKFLDYKDFINHINKTRPNRFIAHFRYSTSGDYLKLNNNQPLVKNDIALAFNGVLDMGEKFEIEEKYNIKLETENDGELALIKLNSSAENLIDFVKNKTFAGIFLTKKGIRVLRNINRPAYKADFEGIKIIASTEDILTRSGIKMAIPVPVNIFYKI